MPDSSTPVRPSTQPLAAAARVVMLALVAALTCFVTDHASQLWWIALLGVAGLPAVLAPQHRVLGSLSRVAEVVVLGLAASQVAAASSLGVSVDGLGVGASAVLPYLAVPVTVTALRRRFREGAVLLAITTATLLLSAAFTEVDGGRQLGQPGYLAVCAQWLILAGLGLFTAGTLHRVMRVRGEVKPQPYAEATRLLTQLRTVARQLPGATLDPGSIAEHLLEELRTVARADRAAVLSASGGGRLVVVAQAGADRVDWETTLDADSAIADAWASQQPQTAARSQARSHPGGDVSALIVPLVAGVRTVGLVVLEADVAHAYPLSVMSRVTALTRPAALRLEAALLFDEVRSLATNEERQRLAREIHDGVAQELVMVGYGIDNALATVHVDAKETEEALRTLRQEVTRVITELRLSLFELRSEVDRHGGLAAAIAEYARTVGASAGLRVHLSLDESTARLPAATEAELLRIAQEAVTNARKHAGASNLWVTCEVDPPYAQIEVSDDGQGIGDQRPDGHYGLAIMAERAERIRGRLEIRPRQPSGTTVAVVLGSSPRRGKVRGSAAAEGE